MFIKDQSINFNQSINQLCL